MRLRLPLAAILGPMLVVGAASATGIVQVEFPFWVKLGLQIVVGAFLGYSVDRGALRNIGSMLKPIALATTWMIAAALLIGYLLAVFTGVDLTTAFLGTSPGGIAEMTAMAMSSNANVALVATLQAFRIITTVLTIPFLARGVVKACNPPLAARTILTAVNSGSTERPSPLRFAWLVWLVVGLIGGTVFLYLRVPAAGVIGSMVAVAVVRVMGVNIARPSQWLRTAAQVGLGIIIGVMIDNQTLQYLLEHLVLVLLVTAGTVFSALGLSGVVQRMLRVDRQTALLACAPGGLVQMGIVADELGANVFVVNVFQLTRMICAVLVLPLLVHLFA
ncbi:MAG: AbrB family transcriptional regulator [Chloroflexi bacterium]|nr:AbrB family transcriptional regulator [Chloroflexota bacterium]